MRRRRQRRRGKSVDRRHAQQQPKPRERIPRRRLQARRIFGVEPERQTLQRTQVHCRSTCRRQRGSDGQRGATMIAGSLRYRAPAANRRVCRAAATMNDAGLTSNMNTNRCSTLVQRFTTVHNFSACATFLVSSPRRPRVEFVWRIRMGRPRCRHCDLEVSGTFPFSNYKYERNKRKSAGAGRYHTLQYYST